MSALALCVQALGLSLPRPCQSRDPALVQRCRRVRAGPLFEFHNLSEVLLNRLRWYTVMGLCTLWVAGCSTPTYDLVIANGRIMDPESGSTAWRTSASSATASRRSVTAHCAATARSMLAVSSSRPGHRVAHPRRRQAELRIPRDGRRDHDARHGAGRGRRRRSGTRTGTARRS